MNAHRRTGVARARAATERSVKWSSLKTTSQHTVGIGREVFLEFSQVLKSLLRLWSLVPGLRLSDCGVHGRRQRKSSMSICSRTCRAMVLYTLPLRCIASPRPSWLILVWAEALRKLAGAFPTQASEFGCIRTNEHQLRHSSKTVTKGIQHCRRVLLHFGVDFH